jgi:cell wall-associated NlpC family hydrolase
MNQSEFISKILGKPWVNRAISFDAVDCWGLCLMYYKHVLSIELPTIKGYKKGKCDTNQGWHNGVNQWKKLNKPKVNSVFTCYKSGKPIHVGIVISATKVLHSRGFVGSHGKVEIHSVRAIESIYGKMTYHEFKGLSNA